MAGSLIIDGHGRSRLFSHVTSSISQGSSVDFGAFDVQKFSRFAGFVLADSVGATGGTLQYRFGVNSGTYHITSTTAISSGGTIIDVVNYGKSADFSITSIDSDSQYSIVLFGEPLR